MGYGWDDFERQWAAGHQMYGVSCYDGRAPGSRAPGRTRTCDLGIRSPPLCPLSYGGGRRTSLGVDPLGRGTMRP
jgi:hypothetical protein